jgi:two-component system OmpR family response regulator
VCEGSQALTAIGNQTYNVVLLDLGLPDCDGLDVLRQVRRSDNQVPILIVTSRRTLEDRVNGLDLGADDYVLKPFDMPELLARIRAVLRRKYGNANPQLSNGAMSLSPDSREVSQGCTTIRLSSREFALLYALMLRPGAILSRNDIEERIYGWGEEVESNAVEFLIHSLRKKLGAQAIKNVRGLGWMVSKAE